MFTYTGLVSGYSVIESSRTKQTLSCSPPTTVGSCDSVMGVAHTVTYLSEVGGSSSAFVAPMLLLLEVLLSESELPAVVNFFPDF